MFNPLSIFKKRKKEEEAPKSTAKKAVADGIQPVTPQQIRAAADKKIATDKVSSQKVPSQIPQRTHQAQPGQPERPVQPQPVPRQTSMQPPASQRQQKVRVRPQKQQVQVSQQEIGEQREMLKTQLAPSPQQKKGQEKKGLLSSILPFGKKEESPQAPSPGTMRPHSEEEAIAQFTQGLVDVKDIIAPPAIEVDFNHILIGGKYFRTLFVTGYPRFVGANWLSPLVNFEHPLDISTFYYPVDSKLVMERLRRKIGEMEATINVDLEAGKVVDPTVKVGLADAKDLQEQLAKGAEKFFHFALYITIHADTLKQIEDISRNVESTLGAVMVITKPATLQQEDGFKSCLPICNDRLYLTRNMDTTSLATTFPFVTSSLTMDKGILYGINKHNKSLVVFDRFELENANCVIFAKSGAGKSYLVKLEALRSLMFGTEIIVIDPEREYETLCNTIGGEYISFSQDGAEKLNPFDLSGLYEEGEDELRLKILSLHGLFKIILGGSLTPEESAILDRALILAYREKGITPDPATQRNEPPLMEDMYKILQAMAEDEAHSMASRLEKFIKGSAAGVFDQRSNVEIRNTFTVFSLRDLPDELRPIAMYMMLEFIWTKIKKDKRRRLLIIDEAWWLMQYPDAARFIYSIAKRARKYYLGLTTITQDVEDFLATDYGKAVVSNSSIQILMKQSPAAVDKIQKVFYLSDGEKNFLLASGVGEGLFFAGANHVAIQVLASENEHSLITTDPKELEKMRQKLAKPFDDDEEGTSVQQIQKEAKVADAALKKMPEVKEMQEEMVRKQEVEKKSKVQAAIAKEEEAMPYSPQARRIFGQQHKTPPSAIVVEEPRKEEVRDSNKDVKPPTQKETKEAEKEDVVEEVKRTEEKEEGASYKKALQEKDEEQIVEDAQSSQQERSRLKVSPRDSEKGARENFVKKVMKKAEPKLKPGHSSINKQKILEQKQTAIPTEPLFKPKLTPNDLEPMKPKQSTNQNVSMPKTSALQQEVQAPQLSQQQPVAGQDQTGQLPADSGAQNVQTPPQQAPPEPPGSSQQAPTLTYTQTQQAPSPQQAPSQAQQQQPQAQQSDEFAVGLTGKRKTDLQKLVEAEKRKAQRREEMLKELPSEKIKGSISPFGGSA